MKIKIAFFSLDMTMNGATKSLISLLKKIDYDKYEVMDGDGKQWMRL